jgi:hypothetical protein
LMIKGPSLVGWPFACPRIPRGFDMITGLCYVV